jgi:hypothetical protein
MQGVLFSQIPSILTESQVLDALALNADGTLLRDTCVPSTLVNRTTGDKLSLHLLRET